LAAQQQQPQVPGHAAEVLLLSAVAVQAKGELPLALPAAPHSMAPDGSVKIPPKWEHVLQQQIKQVSGAKTPPKTPPRSPLVHQ